MAYVLITGATSGIGKDIAFYLSELGYNLVLVARNKAKLEEISASLPTQTYVFPYDLTNLEDIGSIFDFCKEQGLKLDGMVHSAGVAIVNAVKANEIESMQKMMTINYEAFVELVKYFSKRKYSNDGASIVAISSMAAARKARGLAVYSSSKAAVNASVAVFAKELLGRKIRVNSIMPANVATPMTIDAVAFALADKDVFEDQPLGYIDPRDVSYLAEYLLSEKSRFITGACIPINAGMII